MNINYRIIWNATIGKWVVASELAKGRKKASRTMRLGALAIALAAAPLIGAHASGTACALPDGTAGTLDASGVCTMSSQSQSLVESSVGILGGGWSNGNGISIAEGGSSANAAANGDIAIGGASSANSGASGNNTYATVVGDSASAAFANASAFGQRSVAGAAGTTVVGSFASANAASSTAIGLSASATAANAVALGADSTANRADTVSVGSATAQRQIVNVGAGTQVNDAVNVSQLSPVVGALGGGASINTTTGAVIGPTYTLANGGTQTTVGGALGALDSAISNIAVASQWIAATEGGTLNTPAFGAANASGMANVAAGAGAVANGQGSTAVGGGAQAIDGGVALGVSTIAGNSTNYTGAGQIAIGEYASTTGMNAYQGIDRYSNGGGNIAIGGMASVGVSTNANAAESSIALGAMSYTSRLGALSVGSDNANSTMFTRQIVNVSAGTQGTDAVNVNQLSPVVDALGGGASIDATTGAITGPTYTVGDGHGGTTTVNTVGAAVTNLDTRVTTNEGSISTLQQQIGDGIVGLVQQASSGANLTVGANTNGTAVDFTGTSGARVLTGVANGVNDSDAVTIAQLKATGLIDYTGKELGALVYDDLTLATATLGGVNGTTINNLAPGLIASGSMQAVNGGQLFDMQQNFQNQFNLLNGQFASLDGRVTTIEQGIADGTIGGGGGVSPGTGSDSTQVGDGAIASGDKSTAVGNGAVASGDNSTATGAGSQATGSNSTATGAGSVASGNNSTANGANAVASGSGSTAVGEGASATGTNSTALGSNSSATGNNSVALGAGSVADRDNTVSVGSPGAERQITNVAAGTQRTDAANWGQVQDAVNGVQDWANQKFHQVDKRIDRMGAMSAAYGQMAFSANGLDTKNRMGVGIGAQNGQSALAVGYSRQIKPNMNLSFGGSASAGDVSVGAGLAVGW